MRAGPLVHRVGAARPIVQSARHRAPPGGNPALEVAEGQRVVFRCDGRPLDAGFVGQTVRL